MDFDPEADFDQDGTATGGQGGLDHPGAGGGGVGPNGIVESGDPAAYGGTGAGPNTERITTPYMTKYERARILGTRALQIR